MSFAPGAAAVVTGSSRGLGLAIAKDLASRAVNVVVNGTGDQVVAAAVQEVQAAAAGDARVVGVVGSVAEEAVATELIHAGVGQFGRLDAVVNNAGIVRDRSLLKMSVSEFDEVVAVNLRGTWLVAREAARHMAAAGGGAIINVASGSGLFGMYGQANYAAAKAGVVGLNRVLDLELAAKRIRSNVIVPVARTDMTAVFASADVSHREEFPPPAAVAPIASFLASHAAAHISGQVIGFDGTELAIWSHPERTSTATRDLGDWTTEEFSEVLSRSALESVHPDRWGMGVSNS